MNDLLKQELEKICGTVLFDRPLSQYTTVRVGGPADALVSPKTIEALNGVIFFARRNKVPLFVLGAGSNLLVRDKGIRGIVIQLGDGFSELRNDRGIDREEEEGVVLYAEAGVGLPRLVEFTIDEGLTGAEPISGIPGNIGGALIMNAGIPDGSIGDLVESVTFIDAGAHRDEPSLQTWQKKAIRFGYRESHFPRGAILLSTRLKFRRLASELVRGRVQNYRAERIEAQPLNVPNLGSVFKNPQPSGKAGGKGSEKPIHAGRLIEEAGLKNVRVGGARISPRHGNFIVNEGGAKAKEVLALIGLVRDKVKEKFGILLETEVKIVGEE